ncbi:MAG: Uma2 family endonuclease [Nitrospirota bacterium]
MLFPADGKRHEIISGEHYMTPAPSTRHQQISGNLLYLLKDFLRRTKAGQVFDAPTDVVLSPTDVVQPDLLFISKDRESIITENSIQGAPELMIEILSAATRKTDETTKRKLYERYGVIEYWIVDPELERVKVYRLGPNGYDRADEWSRETNDVLTSPLLQELQIPLAQIFD